MEKRIGEKYINTNGESATIIEYYNALNVTIKFDDGTVVKNMRVGNLVQGRFRNKNFKNYYKVGYIGYGTFDRKNHEKPRDVWVRMLERCYNEKFHEKQPTYKDVTVCEEWHNFQNFAAWFEENYVDGWQLDKDILNKSNKMYGPDTCCFVPQEINNLFTFINNRRGSCPIGVNKHGKSFQTYLNRGKGQEFLGTYKTCDEAFQVYKIEKEKYIKEVADKWMDKLNPKVYEALYNYKINITD